MVARNRGAADVTAEDARIVAANARVESIAQAMAAELDVERRGALVPDLTAACTELAQARFARDEKIRAHFFRPTACSGCHRTEERTVAHRGRWRRIRLDAAGLCGACRESAAEVAADAAAAAPAFKPREGKTAPSHVRVVTARGGRRINDRVGRSHNLCGAPATSFDVLYSNALRLGEAQRLEWIDCAVCRARVPPARPAARRRS